LEPICGLCKVLKRDRWCLLMAKEMLALVVEKRGLLVTIFSRVFLLGNLENVE
jgi:hypothetical protein